LPGRGPSPARVLARGPGAGVRGFGGEPGGGGDRFISNCIARAPETFTHDQKETQA